MRRLTKTALYILIAGASALVYTNVAAAKDISRTDRYFTDSTGKPVFLIGYYGWASVAPGYYINGSEQYADVITKCAPYGINYVRVSLGINRFSDSTTPPSYDGRPTPIPFRCVDGKADLDQWDDTFRTGLRSQCELAKRKGVFLHLCLFDGVDIRGGRTVYRWVGSYYNIDNQVRDFYGDLDRNGDSNADEDGDFYRLNDFNNNTGVGYYQRKLIDKVIAETAEYPNIFYEVGNEMIGSSSEWNAAVINYAKTKTKKPVTICGGKTPSNTDGVADHGGNDPLAVKSIVARMVGKGYPVWVDPDGSQMGRASADDQRRAAWYCFAGGAAGWGGFSGDFWRGGLNRVKAGYYRNLFHFIRVLRVKFWDMVPTQNLISNSAENSCLAEEGRSYVLYVLKDPNVTLDLSKVVGNMRYQIYNPKNTWTGQMLTVAGGGVRTFNKPPGAEDWVVYIHATPGK